MSEREAIIETMARAMHAENLRDCLQRNGMTALWESHSEKYRESVRNEACHTIAALESAGYVIVNREADQHQIDAAYAQCGMDGPDLALMYRVMVEAAQEQGK